MIVARIFPHNRNVQEITVHQDASQTWIIEIHRVKDETNRLVTQSVGIWRTISLHLCYSADASVAGSSAGVDSSAGASAAALAAASAFAFSSAILANFSSLSFIFCNVFSDF